MDRAVVVAVVIGIVQGVFEWLPISSEGNITLALTAMGRAPEDAVAFALFLHLGTALSATVYYREDLWAVVQTLPSWRPGDAFGEGTATLSFLGVATLASGVVGIAAYSTLDAVLSEVTGGLFIVLVGVLLVATGVFQRASAARSLGGRETPTLVDAMLVGAGQGLAILPGISRSGTTTGLLLLRGYEGERSFELSFLLSIPAAVGGGLLAVGDTGLSGVTPVSAVVALAVSAIVGYATIDALMRVVARVSFWAVCVGLGGLAVLGGGVLVL
jgi:undecaprenyl-diphosphatase